MNFNEKLLLSAALQDLETAYSITHELYNAKRKELEAACIGLGELSELENELFDYHELLDEIVNVISLIEYML